MADYREISQDYAQGAIKATLLVNGGAAVAVLSQLSDFIELELSYATAVAILLWSIGIILGALTWLIAFFSTRHVDRSERSIGAEVDEELRLSDRYMYIGILLLVVSFMLFLLGVVLVVSSILHKI